jgi:hypothetical protein
MGSALLFLIPLYSLRHGRVHNRDSFLGDIFCDDNQSLIPLVEGVPWMNESVGWNPILSRHRSEIYYMAVSKRTIKAGERILKFCDSGVDFSKAMRQ